MRCDPVRWLTVLAVSWVAITPATSAATGQVDPDSSRCTEAAGAIHGDVAIVNVTTTAAAWPGYGTMRASDAIPTFARPVGERYSSVNFVDAAPNPNLAVVPVGADGRVCYDGADAPHDVILDQMAVVHGSAALDMTPRRLLDTRSGERVRAGAPTCVEVGAPFEAGDLAWFNITPLGGDGPGFSALRAAEQAASTVRYSSTNFDQTSGANPNLAPVRVGEELTVCYDASGADHHVAIDLVGRIAGDAVRQVEPTRLLDTRTNAQPVRPGGSVCVDVADAAAGEGDLAIVNITPTQATGGGYGVLRSSASPPTSATALANRYSSVNVRPDVGPDPNLSVVRLGSERRLCYDAEGATHHVVLDLVGALSADSVRSVAPSRRLDTRPTSPACTPPIDSVQASLTSGQVRFLSDDEFQRIVDLTGSARVRHGTPPAITGDAVADDRIRSLAEARGYRQRQDVGSAGLVWVAGYLLDAETADAYRALERSARAAGHTVRIGSAYRSISRQRAIFVGKLRANGVSNESIRAGRADAIIDSILRFSSIPGYSRHHTGTVVDLAGSSGGINAFGRTSAYRWLAADNFAEAKRHGFVPSYPAAAGRQGPEPEPWEFVFVGRDQLLESDRFDDDVEVSVLGDRLTVTGRFAEPQQTFSVHMDDAEQVLAVARCVTAGADGRFVLKVSLDPRRPPGTDVCVVSQRGSVERLLRCLSTG